MSTGFKDKKNLPVTVFRIQFSFLKLPRCHRILSLWSVQTHGGTCSVWPYTRTRSAATVGLR